MTVENPFRVVKGPYGFDITVMGEGQYGTNLITFDCAVCGFDFFTRADMEACGKHRQDCPQSEVGRAKFRADAEAWMAHMGRILATLKDRG